MEITYLCQSARGYFCHLAGAYDCRYMQILSEWVSREYQLIRSLQEPPLLRWDPQTPVEKEHASF